MVDTTAPSQHVAQPDLPPPASEVGIIGWMRHNLFSSWLNTGLTLLGLYLLYLIIPPLLDWAIFSANWNAGTSRADCVEPGACWTMIRARFAWPGIPADPSPLRRRLASLATPTAVTPCPD